MDFYAVLDQVISLLQKRGRVTYRALQRQFALDDETLTDLKEELLYAHPQVVDDEGRGLVWTGHKTSEQMPDQAVIAPALEPPSSALAQPEHETLAGERRQLTVMFCDLVGSTALSEQLDPEDLQELVRAYQHASVQVIQQYDGHIAQYLGDGLLVYFGYPIAHEDEAVRAVRAGLGIVEAMQSLNARVSHPVQVRVGIHTGLVVIGEMGSGEKREQLALGETPNIAARVQGQATPDTVVLSAATYHLVQGFFTCQDLGRQELKGISTPLRLYHVKGSGEAHNRFDVAIQKGLTPLVGREEEIELLQRRWERAKAGTGQVVLLSGEAGIGKSRLGQVLREQIGTDPQLGILCQCSPFYQNSALYPVIEQLQRFLQLTKEDTPTSKLSKLSQALERVSITDTTTISLLAALLSIPLPDDLPPLQLSPHKQKEQTLQALVTWLQREAEQQPVRLEIEDLHWADPSTLELLGLLIDHAPSFRILVVLTFRPEFSPPWPTHAHMLALQLSRFPQQHIEHMVERVAGKALPAEIIQQLVTKSDGVPLYIEEMTKNLVESGLLKEKHDRFEATGPLPQLTIPATLQDSFASRLDRLAPVRELTQIGAVLGREFLYELILAVSGLDETTLQQGLGQLGEAEILYQRGLPPDASYSFPNSVVDSPNTS